MGIIAWRGFVAAVGTSLMSRHSARSALPATVCATLIRQRVATRGSLRKQVGSAIPVLLPPLYSCLRLLLDIVASAAAPASSCAPAGQEARSARADKLARQLVRLGHPYRPCLSPVKRRRHRKTIRLAPKRLMDRWVKGPSGPVLNTAKIPAVVAATGLTPLASCPCFDLSP